MNDKLVHITSASSIALVTPHQCHPLYMDVMQTTESYFSVLNKQILIKGGKYFLRFINLIHHYKFKFHFAHSLFLFPLIRGLKGGSFSFG